MKNKLYLVVVVLLVIVSPLFAVNGFIPVALEAPKTGRGGIDFGIANDAFSIGTNPSGIAFITGRRIDFSMSGIIPFIEFSNSRNDTESDFGIVPIPSFSMVWTTPGETLDILTDPFDYMFSSDFESKLPRDKDGKPITIRRADYSIYPFLEFEPQTKWKYGFGIIPIGGARANTNIKSRLYPEGLDNFTELAIVSITPSVAYRVTDSFSVGASLNLLVSRYEIDGLASDDATVLAGNVFPDTFPFNFTFGEALIALSGEDRILTNMDQDSLYQFGVGGRVGFTWRITPRLQVGAVYVPKAYTTKARGKASIDANRFFASDPVNAILLNAIDALPNGGEEGFVNNYDVELEFEIPRQVGAGISYLITNNLLVGFDFKWIQYSDTHAELDVKFKNGDNEDFNTLVGSSTLQSKTRLNWRDQYAFGVGVVWQMDLDWTFRAGYNYARHPVPSKSLTPQLAILPEHHMSVGCSYRVDENLTLNFGVEGTPPSTLRSGDNNTLHEAFENSKLTTYGFGIILGTSWTF